MTGAPTNAGLCPGRQSRKMDQSDRPQPTGIAADNAFTARLTIDITPELRGRIEVAAVRRGSPLRTCCANCSREFPHRGDSAMTGRAVHRA